MLYLHVKKAKCSTLSTFWMLLNGTIITLSETSLSRQRNMGGEIKSDSWCCEKCERKKVFLKPTSHSQSAVQSNIYR